MQQGNLLNNLLNLNTSAAYSKTAAQKNTASRPDSPSDDRRDFQSVMAQARPEIPEQKPAAKSRNNAVARAAEKSQQAERTNSERTEAAASSTVKRQKSACIPEKSAHTDKPLRSDKATHSDKSQPSGTSTELDAEDTSSQSAKTLLAAATEVAEDQVVVSSDELPVELTPEMASILLDAAAAPPTPTVSLLEQGVAVTEGSALELLPPEGVFVDEVNPELVVATNLSLGEGNASVSEGVLRASLFGQTQDSLKGLAQKAALVDANGVQQSITARDGSEALVTSTQQTPSPSLTAGRQLFTVEPANINMAAEEIPSPETFLANEADAESTTLELDLPSIQNPKQALLKSGENLLAVEKAITSDVKPAAPVTPTSLVDALGRPLDNSLASARSFTAQIHLPQTMGQPQWNQAMSERVLWMAAQNLTAADIRLDPPELGSMQVKVTVQQDQATVSFITPNPVVREALDQQATRLREMFADQGLNLVHVDVSDRHAHERQSGDEDDSSKHANKQDEADELQVLGQSQPSSLRLIDHYA